MMNETFSINREFDFVRLDGLRRATGRAPHEWDLYIVKELIDNALDADERLWQDDHALHPDITVRMEYTFIPDRKARRLIIEVQNRASFPVGHIQEIFATTQYTSSKVFSKALTRGSLGNALKTLLGIPYTLYERSTGHWQPELKPMSIRLQGKEYQPCYLVDRTSQTIKFTCVERTSGRATGTIVSVGLDVFDQERPRQLEDIQLLAAQFAVLNPHVAFHWSVDLEDATWTQTMEPAPEWHSKFRGLAPVQWYFPAMFQDLLAALYRQQSVDGISGVLSVADIAARFAGFEELPPAPLAAITGVAGGNQITKSQIEGVGGTRLYQALVKASPAFDVGTLGQVGLQFVEEALARSLPVDGEVFYLQVTDQADSSVPFVLELAAAYLQQDCKRQIWTGINFTPTYDDPFRRVLLHPPIRPDDPVVGLRGFLDSYGLSDDTPVVVWLHLICPNVEHSEYSKTEINHLPFRRVLAHALDQVLTGLQQRRDEAELQLEQAITSRLEAILAGLGAQERFIFDQLLARLRLELTRDPTFAAWLARPDAESLLRTYVARYQGQSTVLAQRVARQTACTLSLPVHPDGYVTAPIEHVSRDWFSRHHVNKILFVHGQDLEPVIVENGWLCQMDMALLHNTPGFDTLSTSLVGLMSRCEQPVAVLHDATPEGEAAVTMLRSWLGQAGIDPGRVADLGLDPRLDSHARLIEMMPAELAKWLAARLAARGLPVKWIPDERQVRDDIRKRVDQLLKETLWEGIAQRLALSGLMIELDRQLSVPLALQTNRLDERLKTRLAEPRCMEQYSSVLSQVVDEFYVTFMSDHDHELAVHTLVSQRVPRAR